MVARQNHIWHLETDVVHPLLPQVPVGLKNHAHVSSLGYTLVWDLALGQGRFVALWVVTRRQLAVGAIIANWPVVFIGQHAIVPVIGVGYTATVPDKADGTVRSGIDELLIRAIGVGVAYVIDNSDTEGLRGAVADAFLKESTFD